MRWNANDLEMYKKEKQYIDTLVVPLIPISFTMNQKTSDLAFKGEVLSILMGELERELHGRVFLTPSFTYLQSKSLKGEINRLNQWIESILEQPFKHIFLISHDAHWKKDEQDLKGSYVWISNIPSTPLDSEETKRFINGQLEQLVDLFQTYW